MSDIMNQQDSMTSTQRVRAALEHRPPDRPPVAEYFWPQWYDRWLVEKGFATWGDIQKRGLGAYDGAVPVLENDRFPWERDIYDHYEIDFRSIWANVGPCLDGTVLLEETPAYKITRDGWGVIRKELKSAEYTNAPAHIVHSPINTLADWEACAFDSPSDPRRFTAWAREVTRHPDIPFFVNVAGPLTSYWQICGMERTLADVLDRPDFVRAVVDRIADFQIEVGIRQIAVAAELGNPVLGTWVFDDIAYNVGPLVSPRVYREVCQPALGRLGNALRKAGAEFVLFHSDGDIRKILPVLIEAGVNAIHPLEVRAGMDVVELRARYGRQLCCIGNIDNTGTLVSGTRDDIRREVMRKLPMARAGGYIIGASHSVGLDVTTETYEYFRSLIRAFPDGIN
jgi:uroporphyrinogen decarboxylase